MLTKLTGNDFEEKVCAADKPVVVLFYGEWDPSGDRMRGLLNDIQDKIEGVNVFEAYIFQNIEIAAQLGIRALPTTLYFDKCKMVGKMLGMVNKDMLFTRFGFLEPSQIIDASAKPGMSAWLPE